MNERDVSQQESKIPALAVQALTKASRLTRESGHSVVMVVDGQLVRVGPLGCIPLRALPPRPKVSQRTKRAQP
jgi:hypothetical protein